MPKLISKSLLLTLLTPMIVLMLVNTSAHACPSLTITGSTVISTNESCVEATGGSLGDTLTIENGVEVGSVIFNSFPYEVFNRGTINGNSPGFDFAGDGIVHNDGTGAQIFGLSAPAINIGANGEVYNSGQNTEILGTMGVFIVGDGLVVNSGANAVIEGTGGAGVRIDGNGEVINSGLSARITGYSSGCCTGIHISGVGTVTNSGINALIEDPNAEGTAILIDGGGTVNNSGIGARIIGGDEIDDSSGTGVTIFESGTVTNSGQEALIQGDEIGVLIVGSGDGDVNTVTNSGSGAKITGLFNRGVWLDAACCGESSITNNVINSGLGAEISSGDESDGSAVYISGTADILNNSVTNSGTNAKILGRGDEGVEIDTTTYQVTNTVTNSGSGAQIIGFWDGVDIANNIDWEPGDMASSTVTNSGGNAEIIGENGQGVQIKSFANIIDATVDNSGDNALIQGNFDGVKIQSRSYGFGPDEPGSVTNTVLNSGSNARIVGVEGLLSGVHIEGLVINDEGGGGTVTNYITQDGANAEIIGEAGSGITVVDSFWADGPPYDFEYAEPFCCDNNFFDFAEASITTTITNSGQGAKIIGIGDPGSPLGDGHGIFVLSTANEVTQTVINSGQGAEIIGSRLFGEGVHMFSNFVQMEEDADYVPTFDFFTEEEGSTAKSTQTVTNSGQGAKIEGVFSEGVELDGFAFDTFQTVNNTGNGAVIRGGFFAEGIDMLGLGFNVTQDVTNSGAGTLIESSVSGGVFMEGVVPGFIEPLEGEPEFGILNQTVTNSGAGAIIRAGGFEDVFGNQAIHLRARGFPIDCCPDDYIDLDAESGAAGTVNQTVINSGLGAIIENTFADGDNSAVLFEAFGTQINQTVTNSGDGAKIIGADGSAMEIYSEGYQIDVKVTNSGLGSQIIGEDDEGINIVAYHSPIYDIDECCEPEDLLFDEEGSFFKANVTNSGEGALIMGRWDAVDIQADQCCSFETSTVDVINSGDGAMMHGEGGQGVDISLLTADTSAASATVNVHNTGIGSQILADMNTAVNVHAHSRNFTTTILNSGEGAMIIGGGEEYDGGDGVKMEGESTADQEGTFKATVTNSGEGARIQGHWDGVDIESSCNYDCDPNRYYNTSATVTNSGAGALIWGEMAQGVDIFLGGSDSGTNTAIVNNSGVGAEIRGYNYGVYVENENGTSTITNGNENGGGAIIRSTEEESTAVYMFGSGTVTNNAGSWIEGGLEGTGVEFGDSYDNIFNNAGGVSCIGDCRWGDAVVMGAGEDTVNLMTGSVVLGDIEGGDDDDTVNLTGTGSFGHEFEEFETLNMNGIDWSLNGNGTFDSIHEVDVTNINSGILRLVDGSLDGDVNVNSGGTFAGNGTVFGSVNVMAGGTVAPGASIGTTTIWNELDLSNGGNLEVEFSDGDNDVVVVGTGEGLTTLGGTSEVTFVPYGSPLLDTRTFTFIDGDGGDPVVDTFNTINVPLSFTANVLYNTDCDDDGDACVEMTRTSTFNELGGTPNQKALGSILDEILKSNPTGPLLELFLLFDGITSPEELEKLLQQLTPEQQTSLIEMGLQEKMAFFSSLLGGLSLPSLPSSTASNPGVQLAMTGLDPVFLGRILKSNTQQMASPASAGQWTAFVRPYGQFADLDSKDGHIGFDSYSAGALAGVQAQIHKTLAVGVAAGYSHITTDFHGSDSEGNVDSGHGAVYARYLNGQWRGDAVMGYTYRSFDMSRRVVIPMINALAESDHDGNEFAFQLKGAYDMLFGKLMISPEATMSYTGLWQDGYTETGAGIANMIIDDSFNDSFRTTLGVRGAVKSRVSNMTVVSEAHIHWAHEFLDRNNTINAAFEAFSGTTVNISSRPLPRDSGVAGFGVLGMVRENIGLSLNYDIEFGASDFILQTVRAGAEYRF